MAWLCADKEGEFIFKREPVRGDWGRWIWQTTNERDIVYTDFVKLPYGTIEKLIGRRLTFSDEPVELREKTASEYFDPMVPCEKITTERELNRVREENKALKDDCETFRINYMKAVLEKKYTDALLRAYRIEKDMRAGKKFIVKNWVNNIDVVEIIKVENPFDVNELSKLNPTSVMNVSVSVVVKLKYPNDKKVQEKKVDISNIREYIDPETIDPSEYKF